MRHLLLFACLATICAADPLEGLRFLDGREHRLSEWPGQAVVVVRFCGHCPSARKFMVTEAQPLGELIESEHLAAQLICITPDHDEGALRSYIAAACPKIADTALFAHDPINADGIGLNNILQGTAYVDGREEHVPFAGIIAALGPDLRAAKGYRYPIADLPDSAKGPWWLVERGRPGALSAAIKARAKEPAKSIVDAVEAVLNKRQEALLTAPETLATVEDIERLLVQGEGLPALKPSSERLKTLLKSPALKDELKAREMFFACKQQLASKNPKEREAAKANAAKVAQKYPETTYGKRALTLK